MQHIQLPSHYYDGIRLGQLESLILPGVQSISLGKAILVFKGAKILPVYIVNLSLSVLDKSELLNSLKNHSMENNKGNLVTKISILNDFDSEASASAG